MDKTRIGLQKDISEIFYGLSRWDERIYDQTLCARASVAQVETLVDRAVEPAVARLRPAGCA